MYIGRGFAGVCCCVAKEISAEFFQQNFFDLYVGLSHELHHQEPSISEILAKFMLPGRMLMNYSHEKCRHLTQKKMVIRKLCSKKTKCQYFFQ